MLEQSKDHLLDKKAENTRKMNNEDDVVDGNYIAAKFKYIQQFQHKSTVLQKVIPYSKLATLGFYKKHKKIFDECARILVKHNVDVFSFLNFFIIIEKNNEFSIENSLLNRYTFKRYFDYLSINKKYEKIYQSFINTMDFISDECLKNELFSTKDFLRKIIQDKTLGNYFISGKISKHFLSAIPNFNKVIPKLDHFSKCELTCIMNKYDVYNTEVNDAFLKMKNIKASPISMTDALIFKKRKFNKKT